MSKFHHIPVLKDEVIDALKIRPGGKYIDATIGGGGHTEEIVKRGGRVLGIDRDSDALKALEEKFGDEVELVRDNFSNIKNIARNYNFAPVDGILLDIGVSSHQLDTPERGFSYRFDAPLDMRMNTRQDLDAQTILNTYPETELEEIFLKFAELEDAKEIAHNIVRTRKKKKIITPQDLRLAIHNNTKKQDNSKESKIYQALRIVTNDEITELKTALNESFEILDKRGRLCVITFHSLEDRIVKEFGKEKEQNGTGLTLTKKPITPKKTELQKNRRAKSSKLRVIEKI